MKEKFNWKTFIFVTVIITISTFFTFLSLNMLFPNKFSEPSKISLVDKNCTEWKGIFIPHRENNITVNYTMQNSGNAYDLIFEKWNFTTLSNEYYGKAWTQEEFFDEWCAVYEADGVRYEGK